MLFEVGKRFRGCSVGFCAPVGIWNAYVSCIAVIACIMIGSIVMLAVGIRMIVAPSVEREELVAEFNENVKQWRIERKYFEDLEITATIGNTTSDFAPITSKESYIEGDTSDLQLDYYPLRYTSGPLPLPDFEQFEDSYNIVLNITITKNSSEFETFTGSVSNNDDDDDDDDTSNCYSVVCNSEYSGQWDNVAEECQVREKLSTVCIRGTVSASSWTMTDKWTCFQSKNKTNDNNDKNSGYAIIPRQDWNLPISLGDINVTIRSENDPHLVAYRLTDGSYDFGDSANEERAVGVMIVIIGLLITVCGVLMIAIILRWFRKRKKAYEISRKKSSSAPVPLFVPASPGSPNKDEATNFPPYKKHGFHPQLPPHVVYNYPLQYGMSPVAPPAQSLPSEPLYPPPAPQSTSIPYQEPQLPGMPTLKQNS